eukprot:COSAG06_NODE_7138_length_2616_cov_2.280095_2_plen_143_part_00
MLSGDGKHVSGRMVGVVRAVHSPSRPRPRGRPARDDTWLAPEDEGGSRAGTDRQRFGLRRGRQCCACHRMDFRQGTRRKECACRMFAISTDGGTSFGLLQFDRELISPECQGSMLEAKGSLYLLDYSGKDNIDDDTAAETFS